MNLDLTPEERIDLRRAIREHVDHLKDLVLQAVNEGSLDKAQARAEAISRYETLYQKVRSLKD